MEKQISHSTEFYEMWSSIYTLEAFLKSSPERTMKSGTPLLWRSLWDDASTKITTYLCTRAVVDSDGGSRELLSADRLKLQNEIQKLSIFTAEAGEALWKNSAALFLVWKISRRASKRRETVSSISGCQSNQWTRPDASPITSVSLSP